MEEREVQGISYYLIRKRGMRNLRLKISNEGKVVVSVPYWVKLSKIEEFVVSCKSTIERAEKRVPPSYETGDTIMLLGTPRVLEVFETLQKQRKMAQYKVEDEKLTVYVENKDIGLVKQAIKQMYIDTVAEVLASRIAYWLNIVEVGDLSSFGVNKAKTKWGVCYPKERRLYLSYMCAILPYELIDMVVLHEVCHLKVAGHGPDFWALMRRYLPDLDKRKAQLKEISKKGLPYNLV